MTGKGRESEIVLGADVREGEGEAERLAMERVGGRTRRLGRGKTAEGRKIEEKKEKKGRWKFWKWPSRRSREIEEFRRGYEQIAGMVGSIRDEMVIAKDDRAGLKRSLSPLPVAMAGLKRAGENQEQTIEVLGGVKECLERAEGKDAEFFKTMDRFGDTLSTMDMVVVGMGRTFSSIERTSKQSARSMERLGERLDASDHFLEQAFVRLRETERDFAEHMVVSSKRSAFVTVTVCLLMTVGIAVLAHTLGGVAGTRGVGLPAVGRGGAPDGARMAPMDWLVPPMGEAGIPEDGWALDLPGVGGDGKGLETGPEQRLLFANKFPGE